MSTNEAEATPSTSPAASYFNFKTFITPTLVKILYILWSALIVLVWPIATIIAFANAGALQGIITGIVMLFACAFQLVFARLFCEMTIVVFRIYEELRDKKA